MSTFNQSLAAEIRMNQRGTNSALRRSPALIPVINRRFSASRFYPNSPSTVAIPLPNFAVTSATVFSLNLANSNRHGLCGFREDFEFFVIFVCFTVQFNSKHSSFCRPFCRPLDGAAPGGGTNPPPPPPATPLFLSRVAFFCRLTKPLMLYFSCFQ
jgi:hypothetical protein